MKRLDVHALHDLFPKASVRVRVLHTRYPRVFVEIFVQATHDDEHDTGNLVNDVLTHPSLFCLVRGHPASPLVYHGCIAGRHRRYLAR